MKRTLTHTNGYTKIPSYPLSVGPIWPSVTGALRLNNVMQTRDIDPILVQNCVDVLCLLGMQ